jgi:hypothetical protein
MTQELMNKIEESEEFRDRCSKILYSKNRN